MILLNIPYDWKILRRYIPSNGIISEYIKTFIVLKKTKIPNLIKFSIPREDDNEAANIFHKTTSCCKIRQYFSKSPMRYEATLRSKIV